MANCAGDTTPLAVAAVCSVMLLVGTASAQCQPHVQITALSGSDYGYFSNVSILAATSLRIDDAVRRGSKGTTHNSRAVTPT